jgi:acyl-CoA thioester hydrolase
LGVPYRDLLAAGVDPSVVAAELSFTRPARFEDVLDIDATCIRVGNSSFVLRTSVTHESNLCADMVLTYVNVDTDTATSRPLPADLAQLLRDTAGR